MVIARKQIRDVTILRFKQTGKILVFAAMYYNMVLPLMGMDGFWQLI